AWRLIDRLGGSDRFFEAWAQGVEALLTRDDEIVELKRQDYTAARQTALVTLRVRPPEPCPDHLKPLGLTPRETEILFWISQGKTNPEIASILSTQLCTVKKHVENFLPK